MTSPATSARLADDIALAAKGGERQRVITEVRRINGRRVTVPAVESPSPFSSMGEFRDQCPPMETREGLLKADKVSVVFERIADGKIRVTTSSWDDAKVILANQVLEVATISKPVGLVRVDKPIAYLDIDDTGLVEAGDGTETKESDSVTRCDGVTEERITCERRAASACGCTASARRASCNSVTR